jgi:SAM-dependent methyltransferase
MSKNEIFDPHLDEYENWFMKHAVAYASELRAVRKILPSGKALEVGVGTGRFSAPGGVPFGLDPSLPMLRLARRRGTRVVAAVGEFLPIKTGALDGVLFVTTLCFMADPEAALLEARRVLKPGGILVCAFVDARSPLGKEYVGKKDQSRFYREARFFGAEEVQAIVEKTGFSIRKVLQILFNPIDKLSEPEDARPGYGDGSFVVLQAVKTTASRQLRADS